MIRAAILLAKLAMATPAMGQSFSCSIGTRPACLGFGETVCFSSSMCVDQNSACFDRCQCNFEGFTCRSNVTGAPRFDELLDRLFPLLSRHHLVQHSNFDKQAVNAACRSCGMEPSDFRWADSVTIARRAWPELRRNGGYGLGNLKRVLDLDFNHHDAGEDARAAALAVLHAEAHLNLTFDELIKPVRKHYPAAITRESDPAGHYPARSWRSPAR